MRTDHSRVPRGALHGQSASVCRCWAPSGPPKGGCPHSPAPHWVSSGAHRISWVPSAPKGSRAPNRAGAAQSQPAVLSRHPSRQPTQSRALGTPPPPPASASHGPVSQPSSCCAPPRSYSDNRLHFHAAQTHTAPGRQISRGCPPCCQVRPAGEVCLSLLPAGEAQHSSAPHLHRELPLSPTDPSARSGHRIPSHSRVEGLIARDGTQSLGEHRENLHSPEQQRSWAAIPIGRAPRAVLGAAPHGLSAGAALPGSHFPAESGCTLCSEGRYPQQSISVGWRGRISPWGCSGVSAALWVLCAVGVRPPARSRAGDTRTARCSRTDRFGV